MVQADTQAQLRAARAGDRRALARLISRAERGESLPLFTPADEGAAADRAGSADLCIGVTGAPGAGKSTLVSELTRCMLGDAGRMAVLAVDPSSPISRGALLGDRVRMHRHSTSPDVFIRSMATRSHQGGLARATRTARRLLQACGWSRVILETVGVGQVELEVIDAADLVVVVLNPGWGDEIQANKAGLMEIADIFAINKADRPGLSETRRDIDAVVAARPPRERPPVIETVASTGDNVEALATAIAEVADRLRESGELQRRRARQLRTELLQQVHLDLRALVTDMQDTQSFAALLQDLASGRRDLQAASHELMALVAEHIRGECASRLSSSEQG